MITGNRLSGTFLMLPPLPDSHPRNRPKVINAIITFIAISLLTPCLSHAQSAVDTTIRVTAWTNTSKPYITLYWASISSATGNLTIYRRVKGSSTWVSIATPAASALTYADSDNAVVPGVAYEYSLQGSRSVSPYTVYGAIVVGSNLPLVENRGKVILLVDSTMTTSLSPEIKQLEQNLVADGWTLFRHDVARQTIAATSTAASDYAPRLAELQAVRTLIQNTYNTNGGGNNWALFILGHVPVPYSGEISPDGHGTHAGAWATDTYYADIDGTWTDTGTDPAFSYLTIDTRNNDPQPTDARNINIPGDGKFDQQLCPTTTELQTGRVDLWNMSNVCTGISETEKLRQYLVRDHRFRRNLAPYNTVSRRGLIDDNFGYFGGEAFASSGWRVGFSFFGNGAGKMDTLDWFGTLGTTSMLFAYGCGSGTLTSSSGIGYSAADFNYKSSKAVFTLIFGSWFGDFDSADNFLRAPLAGTNESLGLTCAWSGRGYFYLQHMALGDTIGYSTRYTQNATTSTGDWPRVYTRALQANLMGDPTLRLHSVAPPAKVTATSAAGGITLNWLASPDSGLSGYHVYRSTSPTGPFTRITGVTATGANPTGTCLSIATLTYTDTDAALTADTAYTYLVKTVKMETSASGTYANQSVGEAVTLTHLAATPPPLPPTRFTAVRTSGTATQLTWDDNATDETAYLLERRNPATGVWTQLLSLAAGTTTYTDSTVPIGTFYHYRVRAANGTLYSDYSAETSDYNLPGYLCDTTISYLTTKTSGTVNVAPRRYNGSAGPVSVNYTTSNIYGAAGTDYTATSGTVTWNNGESGPKSAPIPLLAPTGTQSTKIFKVTYTSPTNGLALNGPTAAYVFIRDPAALVLPSPWLSAIFGNTSPDIGYYEVANGNYGLALRSNGWACDTGTSTGDSMRFFYQPVTGDFQITARLNYLSATGTNVRAGVMVRESITAKAPMNALLLSASLACSRYSRVSSYSGGVLATPSVYAPSTTHWLRITRTGTTYTSEQSANGTTWAPAATSISIPAINATAYVGLAMSTDPTTYDVGALGYARLDNVTLYTPPTPVTTLTSGNGAASGQITLTWSASTAATSYRIERSLTSGTGYTLLATVAAPTLSYTDTALTPNTTYYYRIQAINPAYTTTATSPETSATPYLPPTSNGWRYTYFGTEAATGNAAPTADPDGDGLNNLLEYALGLNPTTPNSPSSLPTAQIQTSGPDKVLTYTFVRNKNATDLTYLIEVTSDPSGIWTSFDPFNVSNQLNNLDNSPSNGLQTITVKDTQATSVSAKRFIRLRITGP